jgi:hypothetical protein
VNIQLPWRVVYNYGGSHLYMTWQGISSVVVPNYSIYYAENCLFFWDMTGSCGTPGSDHVAVVLYSQIGMMFTFCGIRSTA